MMDPSGIPPFAVAILFLLAALISVVSYHLFAIWPAHLDGLGVVIFLLMAGALYLRSQRSPIEFPL